MLLVLLVLVPMLVPVLVCVAGLATRRRRGGRIGRKKAAELQLVRWKDGQSAKYFRHLIRI